MAQYFVIKSSTLCLSIIICGGFSHMDVIWEKTKLGFHLTLKQFKGYVGEKMYAPWDCLTFVTPNNEQKFGHV